jgi:hypothetical protein
MTEGATAKKISTIDVFHAFNMRVMILHGGALSSLRPDAVRDNRCDREVHEERMQTERRTAHAPPMIWQGAAWKATPPAVLGKTRRTE